MTTSRRHPAGPAYDPNNVEVKSKFECEFRRFSLDRSQLNRFEELQALISESHNLPSDMPFTVSYTDPRNGDLLPITNDDNMKQAFVRAMPLLRVNIYREQDLMFEDMKDRDRRKKKPGIFGENQRKPATTISAPREFRKIGSILDPDILPDTVRRVKLVKQSSDRPLGFYIRDGTSVRVTPYGLEKVPGIFISRLVPGGLAEGTGLLSVNDEIIEVNGIEVLGKTLDQVTDMMVANSQNLIITVKPSQQPPSTPRTSNTAPPKMRGKASSPPPRGTRSYTELSSGKSDRSTPSRQMGYEQTSNGPTKEAPRKKNSETVYNNYTEQQIGKRHSLQT